MQIRIDNRNKMLSTYFMYCKIFFFIKLLSLIILNYYYFINIKGTNVITKTFTCQYCFQVPEYLHICTSNRDCKPKSMEYYIATCTVPDDVICLGSRTFQKQVECSVVSNHSWKKAFLLSLFMGGFAADRFYLGHVGWGMFKLLTLGGVGIWVIIDFLLISLRVVGPADGSGFAPYNFTAITKV